MIDVARIMSLTKLERVKAAKIAPHDMHITTEPFMIIIWQTSRFVQGRLNSAICKRSACEFNVRCKYHFDKFTRIERYSNIIFFCKKKIQ